MRIKPATASSGARDKVVKIKAVLQDVGKTATSDLVVANGKKMAGKQGVESHRVVGISQFQHICFCVDALKLFAPGTVSLGMEHPSMVVHASGETR